jgi:hypothetical protein
MRQVRYRALIALDSSGTTDSPRATPKAQEYLNHTHCLMIHAACLNVPGYSRYFPAEICWDDEQPLHPGDHAEVTITLTDDEATAFFAAGQRFSLWDGKDIGHGTVSRQVYTEYGPS